jgi:choline kinase
MKAVILAAGVGRRLDGGDDHPPKALLRFDGKTLLQRHLEILAACGVREAAIVVGYRAETIEAEIGRLGRRDDVQLLFNPRFREGSIVSLWTARQVLAGAGERPVLLMDADVLYDSRLMARLVGSAHANCLLLDRNIEPGDEPVKLCVRGGRIVDFQKRPTVAHDWHGESVGFFKLSPPVAAAVAERCGAYVENGQAAFEYEEAIRDLILESLPGTFDFEDITGLPWTGIDFAEDVRRAASEVLPRLEPLPGGASAAAGAADAAHPISPA